MRVLITGGAGSWGRQLTRTLLNTTSATVCIFSRDEEKHRDMRVAFGNDSRLRFFIGDVRDYPRLVRAMDGVDDVYHLAAMKQIDACTYNPIEAVATNVNGSANVIEAAIDAGVKRVLCMSTDKAVEATTLYGSTKAVVEGLVRHAAAYSDKTKFVALRCGNAWGSRGSIVPVWKDMIAKGAESLPVTHPDCTRFHIRLEQVGDMLRRALHAGDPGDILAPLLSAYKVTNLATAMGKPFHFIGLRPSEKIHESMWGRNERTVHAGHLDDCDGIPLLRVLDGTVTEGGSSADARRMTVDELKKELAS